MCGKAALRGAFLALLVIRTQMDVAQAQESALQLIEPQVASGLSSAVVVPDLPLIHTRQFLPVDRDNHLIQRDAAGQTDVVLDGIQATLSEASSGLDRMAKLNFCVSEAVHMDAVRSVLSRRFAGVHQPAVSFVVSALPVPGALVAADAVAAGNPTGASLTAVRHLPGGTVMPAGSRLYVSGQAEKSESLEEATAGTMASLLATLKFLGRSNADVVQLKAFLMPMTDADVVRAAIASCFPESAVPPVVLVEWKSSATTPVEIEMIAWAGEARTAVPVLEYSTPPGMTTSPIYSRVCRINAGSTIYISGLYAVPAAPSDDVNSAASGEREVLDVFAQLQRLLQLGRSDLRHLVKATYYVSSDSASAKLNELRPRYYDAARPPAASKAAVTSVGRNGLGLTIDMITVPTPIP
jgi:enamine deaminase RidA (YjgF/YER057c/UK114 family)